MNPSYNTSTSTVGASRESQVQGEINLLAKAIGEHESAVDTLSQQLGPVIRQEVQPPPQDGKAQPLEQKVAIAELVREQRFKVQHSTSIIQNLLQRLEV